MSEKTKIQISNMDLHYGNFHALKNINMNIKKNQITEHVFVITSGAHLGEFGDKALCLDGDFPEELSPVAMILPFYITAARNCIAAGINTRDKPANRIAFAHLD